MGITVELWRARIGLFSGGRGSRPHSKAPSTKHQPLHFSDTVGTTAKVVQGGLLLLYILKFLSSQDKTEFLKRTRNVGLRVISIAVLLHSLAHLLLLAGDVESNPGPRMVSTVLQGLLDKYQLSPSQVDCQIQQVDIPYLAAYFDDVDFYVDVMELTPGEQTDVKGAKTNQLAVIKCLKIWKGKNPEQATFKTLLEMLVKLRKEEIADQICQYLLERTILNDTTTTQSLKSGTWTDDLLNSPPTQSSSMQESSDTHNDLEEFSIPEGCTQETLSSAKWLQDSIERSDTIQPDHPAEPADDGDVSSGDESFHSATDNRDIFVCPYCKECSPQQFFSKEGCPKKTISVETSTLFPYLDITGLDDEDVTYLEEKLIHDTRDIMIKFSDFSLCIRESIEEMDITLDKVQDCVLSAVVSKHQGVSGLDSEHEERVLAANSLAKIFSILRVYNYISFLNYQVIELLIQRYGTADDHKKLKQYLGDLKIFCQRNVFEVPPSALSSCKSRKTAKVITLKYTEPGLTLNGTIVLKVKVAEILGLEFNALQLCSVKKGCVELHFLVSAAVAEHIFPLSPSQQLALSEIGARLLPFDEEKKKERKRQDEDMDPRPTPTPHENLPQLSHIQEGQQLTPEEKKPQPSLLPTERLALITEDLDPQLTTREKEPQLSYRPKDGKLLEQPSKQEDGEQQQSLLPKELSPSLGISSDVIIPKKNNEDANSQSSNSDADSDNDDNQSTQPFVELDDESIAAKSKSSHSDSGYSTVPSSETSSTIHTIENDFDTYLEVNDTASRLMTSLMSGINSFPVHISIQFHAKWNEIPPIKIHSAVFNGEITKVRFLIEVLHFDLRFYNLLHTAAACGDLNMVRYFIEDRKINAATESTNKETPLHLAALNGHLHIVKYLVGTQQVDPTCSCLDNNDCSPLHNACRSGNVDVVKYLMSEIQQHELLDVNEKAIDETTPIHFAAESGSLGLIRFLLKELKPSFQVMADCDVHSKDKKRRLPFQIAAIYGHAEALKLLLKEPGTHVDSLMKDQLTALHLAASQGHMKCVQVLLQNRASPNLQSRGKFTPLWLASSKGKEDIVELLISTGANLRLTNEHAGYTPLMIACFEGHTRVVELLIAAKSQIECRSLKHSTPLMLAAGKGRTKCVDVLIRNGARINATTKFGFTALMAAAQEGHPEVVIQLISAKAQIKARNQIGHTALHIATFRGKSECVSVLLKNRAAPNSTDNKGFTSLMMSARDGHVKIVELLIAAKVHVNARGVKNGTALHLAAIGGQTECVSVLLKNGANPKLKDKNGGTALMAAAYFGYLTVVDLLINARAPLNAQMLDNGSTALYQASGEGHTECVRALLKGGADSNIADKERWSPLMIASQNGHLAIVELLVASKAHVNAQTNGPHGATALHLAVATGQTEIVSVLLKNGANPKIMDKMRMTALHTAKSLSNAYTF